VTIATFAPCKSIARTLWAGKHEAAQSFGEAVRQEGGAGILYDSMRRRGGVNIAAYRPANVIDVVQADHFEISVEARGRNIVVKRLSA
jgi:hypothetical protein